MRNLSCAAGLQHYLWANRIKYKEFEQHSQAVTARLIAASATLAEQTGRPLEYLRRSTTDKEALAQQIAARDRIGQGLSAIFKSALPCMSFDIHKNHSRN